MTRFALITVFAAALPISAVAETRCGWFVNPTPANYWLTDAHDTWVLASQGTPGAPGFYDALQGDQTLDNWVATNGSYGYGCACVDGVFGPISSGAVHRVFSVEMISLNRCIADPALSNGPFQ